MSEFTVPVVKIAKVEPIENADSIEVVQVLGYRCVVKKGQFAEGDLAVYIPEAAIVPDDVLELLGLKGMLAGAQGNRVKAVKLRGVVSQGLLMPVAMLEDYFSTAYRSRFPNGDYVSEGCEVSASLGITKYQPVIPVHMSGEVLNLFGHTLKYDIENIQKYIGVLQEGEQVVMTEKLHGTWCCMAMKLDLHNDELLNGNMFATSKGQSEDGLAFKHNERNAGNLYHKTLVANEDKVRAVKDILGMTVYVLGEVFGPVQDLTYGLKEAKFRVFDIYAGNPGHGGYVDDVVLDRVCETVGFERVPVLYRGPYSKEAELAVRDGKDTISNSHVREGVVIKPVVERYDTKLGRVQLKSVSPGYLLRKNKDATEFQ